MSTKQTPTGFDSFFDDLDASSIISLKATQIAAPLIKGTPITTEEVMMGGGVRIVMHVFDRSPSMKPVQDLILTDFNAEYVEAIQAAREDDIAALRLGGISFSSDFTEIWNEKGVFFHQLEKLPMLTASEYNPDSGSGTALHAAILDGYTRALKFADEVKKQSGIQPEVDIVVLSDGANNERPTDPSSVRQVVTGSKKGLVRFVYFYFETAGGLDDPAGYATKDLGFDSENVMVFGQKSGESATDRRKRFRRMLRVMSKVSASKHTSATKAAASAPQDPDEDLV